MVWLLAFSALLAVWFAVMAWDAKDWKARAARAEARTDELSTALTAISSYDAMRTALKAERSRAISERTKAALAAAKRRGVVLGSNGKVLAARNRAEAVQRIAPMAGRLTALRGEGLSLRLIADTLNAEGVSSPGGARWYAASVQRALERVSDLPADISADAAQ